MELSQIIEDFELLEDWEDKYRYVIELGRTLEPMPEADHTDANKVRGCASQVWLRTRVGAMQGDRGPILHFTGDSDAHIVKGLIAILLAIYSDRPARDILATDAAQVFDRLGLKQHLTQQRSNGLASMIERIRSEARAALAHV
jgi:cysteine desulfuration protein SufE